MKSKNTFCKSRIVFLFLITVLSLNAAGQTQKLEDPPWIKEFAPPRVVYSVPGMKEVKVKKNLTYKAVADEKLQMDVYTPPNVKTVRPAIIFIHGGRIPPNLITKPKEWGVFISFGELVAASGFVGVTFNQRFYSYDVAIPQSDLNDAISYIRNNAESLGIDKDRICLWAVSAGGLLLSQSLRESPQYVRCMVAYYPVMDLQFMRKAIPAEITDEVLKEFSPVYQLNKAGKNTAPIFIARAGRDDAELNSTIDRFVQEAMSKNIQIDVSNHPEGQHGFDVLDNNKRTHEIIKRTLEFVKANL